MIGGAMHSIYRQGEHWASVLSYDAQSWNQSAHVQKTTGSRESGKWPLNSCLGATTSLYHLTLPPHPRNKTSSSTSCALSLLLILSPNRAPSILSPHPSLLRDYQPLRSHFTLLLFPLLWICPNHFLYLFPLLQQTSTPLSLCLCLSVEGGAELLAPVSHK